MARKTGSHSEITGPRIRAAALKLFAQHGYAAVSMRQIAADVGVQAGALYLYTPDKQSLLFDLMIEHMEDLLAAWDVADHGSDPVKRLEAFSKFHIRHHLERHDSLFISYMELRSLTAENFTALGELRRIYENKLEDILTEGSDAGQFSVPDTKLAAMAVIAMLNGVNTWFREDGRLSAERVERIYWNMVRRAVGAKGAV